ncbi:MAG: RraA family protein [Pseudomonadota bacterium]
MDADLSDIETATLGHFLTHGFMTPDIQGVLPGTRIFGPAFTVRLPGDDGTALIHALSMANPGDVLVVDRCGDRQHACWGAVLSAAALSRGVAGVVIDGFITDLTAIMAGGPPVWCRGRSAITTKIRGGGEIKVPIVCGGVAVNPGDIVLADENGVVVIAPSDANEFAEKARIMQAAEPHTIARLHAGETLAEITNPPALPGQGPRAAPPKTQTTETTEKQG